MLLLVRTCGRIVKRYQWCRAIISLERGMCVKNDRCAHRGCVSNVIYVIFKPRMKERGKKKRKLDSSCSCTSVLYSYA